MDEGLDTFLCNNLTEQDFGKTFQMAIAPNEKGTHHERGEPSKIVNYE